jgi:hypothetical protein
MPDCEKCGMFCKTSKYIISRDCQASSELENKDKDILIMNLQLQLQFEQMKNKIYMNIIQTQTDINVENIIQESNTDVHIFNFDKGNIPIVVHNFIKPKPKIKIKIKRKNIVDQANTPVETFFLSENEEEEKTKKKTYRTVKEYIKISEKELDTKLQEDVVRVDKEIDKIVYNNFDVSHKEISESLEKLFDTIVKTRVYTVSLSSMMKLRKKLLGKLTLEEYKNLILDHIQRLNTIFVQRSFSHKKIVSIISSSLTPLDMRLSYYEGYTNVNIEVDEVNKFGLVLGVLIKHQKKFVCYDKKEFFDNIKNYGLSLFELRECVERCLINRYGFQNIIYLSRPKSSVKDPYSFYTLEKIKEDKRCWKMECRLEDFSTDFADNVLPYCISLFRKIYKDVFEDNIYRPDYMTKSQILEFDCEQLVQNIILLAQPISLYKMFHELIISKSTFTPTESDKFNLYGDDKLQQKRFESNTNDSDEDTCQIIKRLFDGISHDDAVNLLNSK